MCTEDPGAPVYIEDPEPPVCMELGQPQTKQEEGEGAALPPQEVGAHKGCAE